MANAQSGLCKFPWKCKIRKSKELVEYLLNAYQTVVCDVTENSFFIFSLGRIPSWPRRSERRTWGKVLPGYFHNGEMKCMKVIKEHVT
jgi:hypothetical protein